MTGVKFVCVLLCWIYWLVWLKWVSSVLEQRPQPWRASPCLVHTHDRLYGSCDVTVCRSSDFVQGPINVGVLANSEVTVRVKGCLSARLWYMENLSASYWSNRECLTTQAECTGITRARVGGGAQWELAICASPVTSVHVGGGAQWELADHVTSLSLGFLKLKGRSVCLFSKAVGRCDANTIT